MKQKLQRGCNGQNSLPGTDTVPALVVSLPRVDELLCSCVRPSESNRWCLHWDELGKDDHAQQKPMHGARPWESNQR